MQFEEAQTQDLIDSKIMEHLAKAGAGPGQVSHKNIDCAAKRSS